MTDTTKSPIQWFSVIFLAAIVWIMFIPSAPALAAEQAQPCAKEILQAVVHVSGLSLSQLIKSIPDDQSRVDLVRKFVQSVRFFSDNSGYIYVYTLDGVVIGHGGMKNLEGTNLIDHRDAKGFYDVRMAIATAKKGGGFFEHYWRKPGSQSEFKKLTYVEPIAGFNYFIGAGAYVE